MIFIITKKDLAKTTVSYLVAASIIATLGIPGRVAPLEKSQLKSSPEQGNTDGENFNEKDKKHFWTVKIIPTDKKTSSFAHSQIRFCLKI